MKQDIENLSNLYQLDYTTIASLQTGVRNFTQMVQGLQTQGIISTGRESNPAKDKQDAIDRAMIKAFWSYPLSMFCMGVKLRFHIPQKESGLAWSLQMKNPVVQRFALITCTRLTKSQTLARLRSSLTT
jgi:hypothetical protein